MKGMKTIIAMLVASYVVPLAVSKGLTLTPEDQAQMVAVAVAVVGIVMRFFSNGPALAGVTAAGSKFGSWLAAKAPPAQVDIPAVADAVIAEIVRRKAAKAAAASPPKTQETKV